MAKRNLGGVARRLRPFGRTVITEVPDRHGRMVPAEGPNEANYLRLLLLDPTVERITAQPVQISYCFWPDSPRMQLLDPEDPHAPLGSIRERYFPDFLVERKAVRPQLVEVKWFAVLNDPKVQRKMAAGRAYAQRKHWDHLVIRSDELRACAELGNAQFLRRYQRAPLPLDVRLRIVSAVHAGGGAISYVVLLAALTRQGQDKRLYGPAIWRMVWERALTTDLSRRITTDAVLALA